MNVPGQSKAMSGTGWVVEDIRAPQHAWDDSILIRVTEPCGEVHERRLHPMQDADWHDLRIAADFWRHTEHIIDHLGWDDQVRDAVLVDQCLAVEQLFPHLRERLPS